MSAPSGVVTTRSLPVIGLSIAVIGTSPPVLGMSTGWVNGLWRASWTSRLWRVATGTAAIVIGVVVAGRPDDEERDAGRDRDRDQAGDHELEPAPAAAADLVLRRDLVGLEQPHL